MKKIIRENKENNIVQITVADERWYVVEGVFVPSVTWIASKYPKGTGFYKWLANKGWDEAEAIRSAAGDKGSKVHSAIVDLIDGKDVKMEDKYINQSTEQLEEITLEEYECLMSFVDWFNVNKVSVIAREMIVWNEKEGYAGTIDLLCQVGDELWLIDFKTSQNLWVEHELQISAYNHALDLTPYFYIDNAGKVHEPLTKLGILQLGYRRNKKGYKFTEIEDKFDLFLHSKAIWENECSKIEPKKRDYPVSLTLIGGDSDETVDKGSDN